MKVLIVGNKNPGMFSPFVLEQAEAVSQKGIHTDFYGVNGNGILGYLKNRKPLLKKIFSFKPDIIHAHYGFCGLLSNLQRRVKVITTYHGSDINDLLPNLFSRLSIFLSAYNIFVSRKLAVKVGAKKSFTVIPCGLNFSTFRVVDRNEARKSLGLNINKRYVLFSSAFSNKVKNYPLAKEALDIVKLSGHKAELLEFSGYNREDANLLLNAVDCVIVTSFKESGPLVLKEAMAVNTSAVTVDVGDVSEIAKDVDGYFIVSYSSKEIAGKIINILSANKRPLGREIVKDFDNKIIANKIISVYEKCICLNND